MQTLTLRIVAATVVLCLGGGTAFALDFDGDGLSNAQELQDGTSGLRSDTDGDGLDDRQEILLGSDALDADTDGDQVLDGHEGAVVCIFATDCDQDALSDGQEQSTYDALDPDTFGVGLMDGVVQAFDAAGQPPSPDADSDGIPDGWEDAEGLIDWGPFDPHPGQKDMLVEYLHVEGPRSEDFDLDFTPAYDAVTGFFAGEGIVVQWTETTVRTDTEVRPDFLTEETTDYYSQVIGQGTTSTNPYVTTVVLNPQQVQEDLAGDVLGAAFLRSMIVTLDYGAHTDLTFVQDDADGIALTGDGKILLQPVLESHILDARADQVSQLRFASDGIVDLGVRPGGDVYIVTRQGTMDFTWQWRPDWFRTAPNITTEDGSYLQLRLSDWDVDQEGMAATIAHELGHTLGLCHAHDEECLAGFPPSQRSDAYYESTMSYNAPDGQLYFVPAEWDQVADYLTCPPQEPIGLLASGGTTEEVFHAKYEASFTTAVELRACGDAEPVAADLTPRPPSGADGAGWLAGYLVGDLAAAVLVVWRIRPL